ncbi:caspase family protein, partial [Bradyrhizobium canariense]|nr:caspase family protein [Bradyrhizobium canariense]
MVRLSPSVPMLRSSRAACRLALSVLWMLVAASTAQADKRVALVLGVSNYQSVARLANPDNDAAAISDVFKRMGFDIVELRRDLGVTEMRRAVRDFAAVAADSDMAVVYYAGHGIEVNGANFLIPADARLQSDFDVEDEAVPLDRILQAINPAKRLRLVILDACRDNPFAERMTRSVATRSMNRGLAKIEPATADTLIAFAAKAGAVAGDGDG